MSDGPSLWSEFREFVRPRSRWRQWRSKGRHHVPAVYGNPLDFVHWANRSTGGRQTGFPEHWSVRTDLPIEGPSRVAVVIHVFYPELFDELLEHISRLPVPYDLLVTNASGQELSVPTEDDQRRHVRIFDVPNHGRDILPTVNLVNAGLLDPYDLVLKVHTKRSEWREQSDLAGDGARWRASLLDGLLGDRDNICAVLDAFAERPELGIVTADGSVLGPEYWSGNEGLVGNLLRRMELRFEEEDLRFAAGSMYWARGFALQGLRALNLIADDFDPEAGQVNVTTAHAVERALGLVVGEAGLTIEERSALTPPASAEAWRRYGDDRPAPKARVVPFYLPQFHPFPENDRWWGPGFTEWTNVTGAKPVYRAHHQPRLPRDLGFYDLRLDAVREQQRDLAAAAGIEGFMYYYYWFAGQRLMELPIEALHRSDLDQPFCLMWANENWTRRWDGRETDVLIAQDYDRVPAERFIDDVLHLLADDRYLTIGGRKLLAVYRPGQMDDFPAVVAAWRESARAAAVGELHVVAVDQVEDFHGLTGDPAASGLDGSLGFPPHHHLYYPINRKDLEVDGRFEGNILSYEELVKAAEAKLRAGIDATYHPGVMVAFDNTPRRQWQPDLWYGSNPYTFRRWLQAAVDAVASRPVDERLVFVNAWNEWAEGAVLEPTDRHGATFLLAVRDVVYG